MRKSRRVPSYRKHKPSGQAVVTLSGRDHYLGPHGSKTSIAEYDRLIAEWLAGILRQPAGDEPQGRAEAKAGRPLHHGQLPPGHPPGN